MNINFNLNIFWLFIALFINVSCKHEIKKSGANLTLENTLSDSADVSQIKSLRMDSITSLKNIKTQTMSIEAITSNLIDPYDYSVSGVPKIQQLKSMDCWATSLTMLYSWKQGKTMQIEEVLKKIDDKFLILYQTNAGVMPNDEQELYQKAGLKVIQGSNPTIQYWYDLLKKHGPLSITVDADPKKNNQMIHALVIIGLKGDGSEQYTRIKYIDPGDGREHDLEFNKFLQLYEGSANWPLQIIYWP